MKKIDRVYMKGKYLFIVAGICLSACLPSCSADDADFMASSNGPYDTAGALFGVNGKVTAKDGQPLDNIQIEVPYNIADSEPYQHIEKLRTAKDGTFEWRRTAMPRDQVFRFIFKDLNASEDGAKFKNDTVDVKFTLKQLSEAGGNGIWNYGSVIKDMAITLERE